MSDNPFEPNTQGELVTTYISHPLIAEKKLEARAYQLIASKIAITSSTLVVLPTGTGKTAIEFFVIAEMLRSSDKLVIMIAPTIPLVSQHLNDAKKMLNLSDNLIAALTGRISPTKRENYYKESKLIIATPQVIRNDLQNGILLSTEISLIVFDEAHHAVGNDAMAEVGDYFLENSRKHLVLAATASPGSNESQISEVCERLGIEQIFTLNKEDPLLSQYISGMKINDVKIEVPSKIYDLTKPLKEWMEDSIEVLKRMGLHSFPNGIVTAKTLQQARKRVQLSISRGMKSAYRASSIVADCQRAVNLISTIESQGIGAAREYLERSINKLKSEKKNSKFISSNIVKDTYSKITEMEEIHPKTDEVLRLVLEQLNINGESRVIVFAHYRDTVSEIGKVFSKNKIISYAKFVGQSSKDGKEGMSQKEQINILEKFKQGELNVLIATSVGEEGLDVPSADRVIFYEPVASEIRTIQRRGRTARNREGEVFVLVATNTRDEGTRYASKSRERKMIRLLEKVKKQKKLSSEYNRTTSFEHMSVYQNGDMINIEDFIQNEKNKIMDIKNKLDEKSMNEVSKDKNTILNNSIEQPKEVLNPDFLRPKGQSSLSHFTSDENDENDDFSNPILDGSKP